MFAILGLAVFAVCFISSRKEAVIAPANRSSAGGLMEQADACAGISPHRAQELRTAAMACLSVVGQR